MSVKEFEEEGREELDKAHASDLRTDLDRLDSMISDLKVLYEQYFLGVITLPPDKSHNEVKAFIRRLRKAPFKTAASSFRLRTVETRYNTLYTYWQRVLREREEGTYARDVFKANLRERNALADEKATTSQGAAERSMGSLFDSYREALEKATGKKQSVDFEAFQKSLIKRAKELKERHGITRLAFKVVVKDGKVSVQAKAKEE